MGIAEILAILTLIAVVGMSLSSGTGQKGGASLMGMKLQTIAGVIIVIWVLWLLMKNLNMI